MSDAPERIWAVSHEGKWKHGSWGHKPRPGIFPDEREFVLASRAGEDRRQRDLLLAAAEYAEHVVSVRASLQEGTEADRITRDKLRAAIAECAECGREER